MNTSSGLGILRVAAACAFVLLASSPLAVLDAAERSPAMASADGKLAGKNIVLAGRLPELTAAQATALIEKAGGTVVDRVSKTTNYVVAGERPGKKVDEARSLGVRVIDEGELRRMLGVASEPPAKKKKSTPKK